MTGSSLATWTGSPNYTPGRVSVDYISLHIMAGGLPGTDSTFQNPQKAASATYGVGDNGAIHQYVDENNSAWADGSGYSNARSISIEHAGGLDNFPNTDACVNASAQLCADIARRYGWTQLIHGQNVKLHREIPPFSHPSCPDKCTSPLRWQEIIDKANAILNGQPITTGKETTTMFMIQTTTPWGTTAYALLGEITGARALSNIEALGYAQGLTTHGTVNWDVYNLLITQAWQRHNDFMTAMGKGVAESVEEATQRILNATKKDGE